MDCAALKEGFW